MKMRKSTIMAIEAFGNTLYRRFAAKTALILTLAGAVCLAGAVSFTDTAEAATASKTYAFATTNDGFAGIAGTTTDATNTYVAGSGSPAGSIQTSLATKKTFSTNDGWVITGTWESIFGIAAGSTVTLVDGQFDWSVTAYPALVDCQAGGSGNLVGPLQITDSADGNAMTLEASLAFSAVSGFATRNATTTVAVPAAIQASNSSIKIKIFTSLCEDTDNTNETITVLDDNVALTITYTAPTPPTVITIGQGTDPSAAPTVCPGSGTWTDLDNFTLVLDQGSDTVTGVTVALGAGDGAGISQIRVATTGGAAVCTNAAPSGDTIAITGCSIAVSNVSTERKIQILPKAQAGPAGASYAVNGTLSNNITLQTNNGITKTDNDTASDTVTVDDLSPSDLAGSLTATGSDGQISLAWTSTAVNVVLVNSTDSTVNTPVEGTAYVTGNFIGGTDKVVYAGTGTGTPKVDSPLSNGVQMWYKIFVVDACNNHSTPGLSATATPSVAAPCDDTIPDAACADCHLMPPSDGTRDLFGNVVGSHDSASHVEGVTASACDDCHGSGVLSYGTNHRAGTINMAANINGGSYSKGTSFAHTKAPTLGKCSNTNCHGIASPTWGNTGGASCSSCHPAQTGTNPVLDGKHKMHFNTSTAVTASTYTNQSTTGLYRINCAVCHDTAGQSKKHIDSTIQTTGYRVDVLFNATQWSTTWGGGYSGGTTSTATASGSGFIYYTGRTCNNLYCHSTVQANGGTGAPTYTTPNWAPATTLNCNGCHATVPATGQHATHVTTMAYACTKCHKTTAGAAPSHVNGVIDMQLINGASAVYGQGSSAARNGYSGCTNVYCHGAFNGNNGTVNTPSWGNAAHGNCGTCHGATAAQTPSRINHPRHAGNGAGQISVLCADCHGGNPGNIGHENVRVSWNLNTATAGRLKRLAADANPTYRAATSGTTSNAAPSPSYGTCANIYCHSNAQVDGGGNGALTYGAPTWGATSVACAATACHNNTTLTTGAHERHVATGAVNYVCNNCHNGGGDQTANHANKLINIAYLGANAVKGTYSEGATTAPGSGSYGTCASTACHGTTSPVWSASRTQTAGNAVCTTCHGVWNTASPTDRQIAPGYTTGVDTGGSSSAADMNVGAHSLHLGTGTMSNATGFACSTCHTMPSTVGQAGHIDSRQPAELKFNTLANRSGAQSPTYAGATGTCNTTYCHANTRATWVANTTTQNPVWNNTGLLTGAGSDCTKCHNMTSGHYGSGCSGCHDHVAADNISFIATYKWKHADGVIQQQGGDCLGCHASQKASAAFPGKTRAKIVGGAETAEGGDFIRRSGHVSSDTGVTSSEIVTKFDCSLCHMEGDTSANQAQHDGYVDLRNVDSASGGTAAVAWPGWRLTTPSVAITTAHRNGMDTFCMNCHDLGGAAGIAVSGAGTAFVLNPGASSADALHPFNSSDTLANGRDTLATYRNTTYGRVLNVKDQFNSGNLTGKNWASHHNLNQWNKRYGSASLNASVWSAYTTKEGAALSETAGLHCSDCHLNESNAHGSANSWYMLCGKSTASCADVTPATGTAASTDEVSCFRCHNSATYATGTKTTNSQHDHADCESRIAAGDFPFEIHCTGCHGGFSSNVDGAKARGALGAIHGTNESYTPLYTGSAASKRYRFMSGAAMRFYNPLNGAASYAGEANWQDGTAGGCYTVGATDTWNTSCTQHNTNNKANDATDGGGGARNLAY